MNNSPPKDISADALQAQAPAAAALQRAAAIMARLRGLGGCPWDREQTFDTIKRHTLEETYEVFDAIERRDFPGLKDELGDLLLQVLFYAQMGSELPAEAGRFDLRDVAENLNAKLTRRHPHVFGDTPAADSATVLRNWEQIKTEEKKATPANASLLDDISRSMPATLEAAKLGAKAAKAGFDWPDASGLFDKLAEETAELRTEIDSANQDRIESEFGDLLFTMMNLARHIHVDAESALRRGNAKFRARFAAMERARSEPLESLSAEALESLWSQAKAAESAP